MYIFQNFVRVEETAKKTVQLYQSPSLNDSSDSYYVKHFNKSQVKIIIKAVIICNNFKQCLKKAQKTLNSVI